jgi:hypothetical protein
MPWRIYTITQKYIKVDGSVSIYKVKNRKWIKTNKHKPQSKGPARKSMFSKRFGFLELYNRKEQQYLVCPSGYSISQCFNVMSKLWFGYKRAMNSDKSVEQMKRYAKAIQSVQEDMGIATASFPHLGLYGDSLVLNDRKGNRVVFEDHSALKQKQKEYEKWQAENAKLIQEKLMRPEEGQEIVTFADDLYPYEEIDSEEIVPCLLEPKEDQTVITFADEIPFRNRNRPKDLEKQVI